MRLRLHHADHVVEQLAQRHRREVEPQPARFDARQVEQAVDQRVQVLAAAVDGGHRLARRRRDLLVAQQDLRVAEDAVERRAELVGDAGDIAGLRLVGGFREVLGLLQRGVGAAARVDLVAQQQVLAAGIVLRHAPALARQHHPPRAHRRHHHQQRIDLDERRSQGAADPDARLSW